MAFLDQHLDKLGQKLGVVGLQYFSESIDGTMIRGLLTLKDIMGSGVVNAEVLNASGSKNSFTVAIKDNFQHGNGVDHWFSATMVAGA